MRHGDVKHVQAGNREEGRAKERRRERSVRAVKVETQLAGKLKVVVLHDQVLPLNQVKDDKRTPKKIVAKNPLAGLVFLTAAGCGAPKTIVKLEESRQKVITEEKTMLDKTKGCRPDFRGAQILYQSATPKRERVGNNKQPHSQLAMTNAIREHTSVPICCGKMLCACLSTHLSPPLSRASPGERP